MVGAGLHGEDHEQNLHWSSFTEAAVHHVPCNQSNEAGAPGEQVSKEASGRSFRIAAGGDPGCGSARQPSSRKIERIHSRSVCKHLASRRLQCMAPNLLTLSRMTRGAHPVDVHVGAVRQADPILLRQACCVSGELAAASLAAIRTTASSR